MLTTKEEIKNWLDKHKVQNYLINEDSTVDVSGNVDLRSKKLTQIEVQFSKVSGYFNCSRNDLTSLSGAPNDVESWFFCFDNDLTSLEGGPQRVGGIYNCSNNNLTTLIGAPTKVGDSFSCDTNRLECLTGAPLQIGHDFLCRRNPLIRIGEISTKIEGQFVSDKFEELDKFVKTRDFEGNYHILAEHFNYEIKTLADIRAEKALLEWQLTILLAPPPVAAPGSGATTTTAPKRKMKI